LQVTDYLEQFATPNERLDALRRAVDSLTRDFGTWKRPWGEINRFQRLDDEIESVFDDRKPSAPVAFASSEEWGSLAAYYFTGRKTTKKNYGDEGNTFVAVVEFGPRVKAKAVSAGGQSGNPTSPHFADQVERYRTGNLRDVWFYRTDVTAHAEKTYRPGAP
jgi:acyl-homoserine-lactone acylase